MYYKGKKLSILGDSLSTYQGVSNDGNINHTLLANPYFYRYPFPEDKTYWSLLLARFGLVLLVNNSYSGGNLSGQNDPISGVSRARELASDAGDLPDLVLLLMGLNDLGRRVNAEVFAADYQRAVETIGECYPNAELLVVTLPDRDPVLRPEAERFNSAILAAAERMGERAFVADLFHSRRNNDTYYMNTLDSLHPDEDGMRIIAEIIGDAIARRAEAKGGRI